MRKNFLAWAPVIAMAALLFEPHAAFGVEAYKPNPLPPSLQGKVDGSMAKASTALRRVFADFQAHAARGGPAPFQPANARLRYAAGRVLIDAVAAGDAGLLLQDLERLGLKSGARYGSMVSGMFPLAAIDRLVALGSLRAVRPSWQPITNAGLVTSEGVVALRADFVHLDGITGAGTTIGVLSDSYDQLDGAAASQLDDDLPLNVNVLDDSAKCGFPFPVPCSDEGRAMMELIHDVAPGADLAFHTAFGGMADFADGIEELAAAGADIIVDDVFYFAEPMFQDGIIAKAVDTVVAQGVVYASSAGNQARQSYESDFIGAGEHLFVQTIFGVEDRGELHDFDPGPGVDYRQSITIPSGSILTLVLQWDQPTGSLSAGNGSKTDIDVYLVDQNMMIMVDSIGDNVGTGEPIEILQFATPGTYDLLITHFTKPVKGMFKYVLLGGLNITLEYATNSSTTYGHSNAAGALAVGAAFYQDTPEFGTSPAELEYFSSAGGTPILFNDAGQRLTTPDLRQKPEVVGPDGTNTTFFYADSSADEDSDPNFFGTSASAPHVAAVAALMREANPAATPDDIYSALENTAEDMGELGVDFDSGFGFVRGDLAVDAMGGDATPVVTPPADVTAEATGPMTNAVLGQATAMDAEDGPLVPSADDMGPYPVGPTVVTWSATDSANNTGTATQNVTVTDTTAPSLTEPADVTVEATGPTTPVDIGTATANDLVDGAITPSPDDSGPFPVGTTFVTWTATDNAGNSTSDTQNVTVTDTTAPSLTEPADVTVEATGSSTPVNLGTATADDLVDGAIAPTANPSGPFSVGTTVVTWTATDNAGNSTADIQNVTVTDTTAPTVTAPADITVVSTGALTDVNLGTGTANDLVDGAIPPSPDNSGPFPVGTTVVTWSATDTAGNTGSDPQNVTVTDPAANTPPVANAGPDQTVILGVDVTLAGSGFDANNDLLGYAWTFLSKPRKSNAVLQLSGTPNATFTPDKAGTYELQLQVTDGTDSDTDTVLIDVDKPPKNGGGSGGGKPCNPKKPSCNSGT